MAKPKQVHIQFSQELFDRICARIAAGGDGSSLLAICKEDGMPERHTFMTWTKRTEELRLQYERARIDQEDTYFDELIEIADTETDPAIARNRMDARKWAWARMNRAKFGDKTETDLNVKGEISTITRRVVDPTKP